MSQSTSVYSVKSVKSTQGRNGGGYIATLCRDGAMIATVSDYADGSAVRFDWSQKLTGGQIASERSRLDDHVKALPAVKDVDDEHEMDADLFVEQLVNDELNMKRLNGLMKKGILFIHDGKLLQSKPNSDQAAADAIQEKYPSAKVLNFLTTDKQLELCRAGGHI